MFNKEDINARLKKSIQGKTPKLKCVVSGVERTTSMDYLKTKEEKFGSIENFTKNYISSEALRLIKQGVDLDKIKLELNPSDLTFTQNINIINEAKKYYGV